MLSKFMLNTRILVLDDEQELLSDISEILEHHRYRVFAEQSIASARRLMDKEKIDILLLDVRIPGQDGLAFARSIAQRPPPRPSVILMSGYATMETLVLAIRASAADFLIKPFSSVEMLEALRRVENGWGETPARAANPESRQEGALRDAARLWQHQRSLRSRFFPAAVCSGATWEILLQVGFAHQQGRPEYPSSLAAGAGISITTALRHIADLETLGLVTKQSDGNDRRRSVIAMTADGDARMREYLASVTPESLGYG